ncbi:hypothetical protein AAFP30_14870 [Gordonia sp. CPCC 205515]|uniref:hypothetical protein n=1 Tax=Gordonia sp. CPCC 205515 TaxID=3140791 RepID=UPI003AF368A8
MSRRTLTVFVDELAIEDGAIPPPRIGSISVLVLDFTESAARPAESMTVHAVLDLHRNPRRAQASRSAPEHWYWTGDLHGDGWQATWRGERPLTGAVTLTGHLCHWYSISYRGNSEVRGRVQRIQVVSIPFHAPAGAFWEPMPAGSRRYRDVATAPRWFDRDALHNGSVTAGAVVYGEIGVLVELDLDDLPPRPARPRVVPQSVSAGDQGVWVVDEKLPVAALITDESATEYLFSGAVASGRTIRATPTGCTITDGDTTFSCTNGLPIRQIAGSPSPTIDAISLYVEQISDTGWRLVLASSRGARTEIGAILPGYAPGSVIVHGGAFIVAVDSHSPHRHTRLLRITTDGQMTLGPALPNDGRHGLLASRVFSHPLRILLDDWVFPIHDDLGAGTPIRLGRSVLAAGQAGDTAWIVTHPPIPNPHRNDPRSWWPLPGPTDYDIARGKFWLLTLLDTQTLPLASYPVATAHPHLTKDRHGIYWITDCGLRRLPDKPMTWSEPVDLDAAITRTVPPGVNADPTR